MAGVQDVAAETGSAGAFNDRSHGVDDCVAVGFDIFGCEETSADESLVAAGVVGEFALVELVPCWELFDFIGVGDAVGGELLEEWVHDLCIWELDIISAGCYKICHSGVRFQIPSWSYPARQIDGP